MVEQNNGADQSDTPARRQLLRMAGGSAAYLATALAGCSAPERDAVSPGGSSATGGPTGAPVLTATSSSPTSASTKHTGSHHAAPSSATTAAIPDRAAIVRRFGGIRPHQWSETASGVVTTLHTDAKVVALTFDFCGGPSPNSAGMGVDTALIELLRRHEAKATLFLNERWIRRNRRVADDLAEDPLFEIGNHSTRHLPLSVTGRSAYGERGTRNAGEVDDEVAGNTAYLTRLLGRPPRFFRSGTAYYDEVAVRIVRELRQQVIGFTVNGDAGTTFSVAQIGASLASARAGDIVVSHGNRPEHSTAEGYAAALPALLDRLRPVHLSDYL